MKMLLTLLAAVTALLPAASASASTDPGKVFPANAMDLATMPNIEYIFRGYNLLTGNPLANGHQADPGFGNLIFESRHSGAATADLRYQIPDGVSVFSKIICDLNFASSTHSNEKEYHDDLKIPVKVSFMGFGAAFMANQHYRKTVDHITSLWHSFVKTESVCSVYETILDTFNPPKFAPGFLAAAKQLEQHSPDTPAGSEIFRRFVDVYGTHYIHQTHMGAKYAELYEMEKTVKEALESEGVDINVAASGMASFYLGITSNTTYQTSHVEKFHKATLSRSITSFGSRPPSDGSAMSWASSVFSEPLPISYSLMAIDNLFTANFMANTELNFDAIRPNLKEFIESYCKREQDSLEISSCQGPNAGCSGGHGCHHNAHCIDSTEKGYECQCNQGFFGDGRSCSGWGIQSDLYPDVYGVWGEWGQVELCPNKTFAYKMALKVDPMTSGSWAKDDSGLNGIKLYCRSMDGKTSGEVTSSVGADGSWTSPLECAHQFLNGFRMRSEGQITGDNVMATNVDMSCQSGEILEGEGVNGRGLWSSWTFCPVESAICGLQSRVLPAQGQYLWQDDVGLTNSRIICCKF